MKKSDKELLVIKNGNIVGRINLNNSKESPKQHSNDTLKENITGINSINKFSSLKNNTKYSNSKNSFEDDFNLYQSLLSDILNPKPNKNDEDSCDILSQLLNSLNINLDNNKNSDIDKSSDDKTESIDLSKDLVFNLVSNDDSIKYNETYTIEELLGNINFVEVFADQILSQLNDKIKLLDKENANITLSYKDYKDGIKFEDIEKKLTPKENELFNIVTSIKKQQLIGDTTLGSILNKLLYNVNIPLESLSNKEVLSEDISIESLEYLLDSIYKNSFEMLNKVKTYKELY